MALLAVQTAPAAALGAQPAGASRSRGDPTVITVGSAGSFAGVRVSAHRGGRVRVAWTISCADGQQLDDTSGEVSMIGSRVIRVSSPARTGGCSMAVAAQSSRGPLKLKLLPGPGRNASAVTRGAGDSGELDVCPIRLPPRGHQELYQEWKDSRDRIISALRQEGVRFPFFHLPGWLKLYPGDQWMGSKLWNEESAQIGQFLTAEHHAADHPNRVLSDMAKMAAVLNYMNGASGGGGPRCPPGQSVRCASPEASRLADEGRLAKVEISATASTRGVLTVTPPGSTFRLSGSSYSGEFCYAESVTVTLRFSPDSGYRFDYWFVESFNGNPACQNDPTDRSQSCTFSYPAGRGNQINAVSINETPPPSGPGSAS